MIDSSLNNRRRITAVLLVAVLLLMSFTLAPVSAFADEPGGNSRAEFAGGDGSQSNPYQVATADQLNNVRNHLDKHFIQIADIDLNIAPYNTGNGWVPIGTQSAQFTGSFNGNEKTIKNLYINSTTESSGLFGYVYSSYSIENMRLENVNVQSTGNYTGALAGQSTCTIRNTYVTGSVKGVKVTGGLVGTNAGQIERSYSSATVQGTEAVGGLVGYNFSNITNAYARGNVKGEKSVGGLIGICDGSLNVKQVFSTGSVAGSQQVGGLVGDITGSPIFEKAFWDVNSSGLTNSAAGEGKTTAQLKDPKSYLSWAWDTAAWYQYGSINDGYFFLKGLISDADAVAVDAYSLTYERILGDNNAANFGNTSGITYVMADLVSPWPLIGDNASTISWSAAPTGWIDPATGKVTRPTATQGNQEVTLTASLAKGGFHETKSFKLTVTVPESVSQPVANLASGGITQNQTVTLTTPTAGAQIYYTTDGSAPTMNSHLYTGPIQLSNSCILKAFAAKKFMTSSPVVTYNYAVFAGGDGSVDNPFQIFTPEQLNGIRYAPDKHFVLGADIYLSVAPYNTGAGWLPIPSFSGTLNGNGKAINNLFINRPNTQYVGFINELKPGALIKNLKLSNVNIVGGYAVGGLAAANTMAGNTTIQNVALTGRVESTYYLVGGLVGEMWSVSILNSMTDCEVYSASAPSGPSEAGGLAGSLSGSVITNCYALGKVNGTGSDVGGLVGQILSSNISNSYAKGKVVGTTEVGGLVGRGYNTNTVTSSYWDKETSGIASSAFGEGKTTNEMKTKETYVDWNFTDLWSINSSFNGGYPFINPAAIDIGVAKDALTWGAIRGGNSTQDNITKNLVYPLPTIGAKETTIAWSLENPSPNLLDTATGAVTRPAAGEADQQITLITTITKDGISATKSFPLTIKAISKNPLLSDMKINGITVTGFTSNQYNYSVELPHGTQPGSEAAKVAATAQDPNATLEITQAAQFPGTAKVKVTAEDSVTTQEYTINFTELNRAPKRKAAVPAGTTENVEVNKAYTLDLSTIFEDEDDDVLTYKVSVDNAAVVKAETNYSRTPTAAGTTKLVFTANDGKSDSLDTYTVTLTATNPQPTQVAPSITTQPTEQAVSEGADVQFTVVAAGSTPLSYQWKKGGEALSDGGRISGANTSQLTITGAQMSDAGSYSCYVSNTAGNVTSNAAELLMNGTSIVNAYINPSQVSFNLDTPADVSTAITWNGATAVMGVKNGTTSLDTSAYSVNGNTLIIEESYLSGLGMNVGDEINLTISFDAGDVTLKVTAVKNHIPGNHAPKRKAAVSAVATANVKVNSSYSLDLSTIFEDEDGDALTYKVSVDNAATVTAETNYSYTSTAAGTTKLVFMANDGKADSLDIYTVTLTATEAVDPDIARVNAAKDAIQDGTVKVSMGATQDDKTAAVQSYVNNIISNNANAAGVTAIVTYSSGDQYNVALSKGSVNDDKSLTMTIVEAAPITVNSMSVKASPSKTSYTAGEKLNLTGLVVTLHQDASTSEDIDFEDFAGNGITVSPANGTVLTTTDTEVTITHTASGESVKENIMVNPASSVIRVTGITLNPKSITLYSNTTSSSAILATTIAPSDATDKGVSWQSSNPAVATVDAAGKVSAVSNGIATITATTADGGYTASCTVTVTTYNSGTNSGGGGGSSGGMTVPKTNITTDKQPYMPTVAKMSVSGTVKEGILSATITEQMVKDAIKAAQDAAEKSGKKFDGIAVDFNVIGSGSYTNLNATIDAGAIDRLKELGVKFIKIGSSVLDVTLDTGAIAEVDNQSTGTVTVSARKLTKLSDAAKKLIGNRPVFDITVSYQKNGKTEYVSKFGKGIVTLGLAYEATAKENKGNLFGVYVDKNGKPELLTNSSYDNTGRLIFSRNSLSTYGVGYKAPSPAFIDTAKHWAKDNIDFVVSRDLISGTSTTTFAPNTAITRADFLMALGRLSGADVSSYKTSSFTDVKGTDTAMPYIEWAVKNKIVQGIGGGKFGPDEQISRQDMAVMMQNYATATGYKLPVSRQSITFADDAKISAYAKAEVKAIQQTGVVGGKGNNLFDPQGNATRAEASTILRRFVELVIDEGTARGWVQNDAGLLQYIGENGKPAIGWLTTDGGKYHYYFTADGSMVAEKWLEIEGKWYYFNADGSLAKSTKIDGYEVDENGVRKVK